MCSTRIRRSSPAQGGYGNTFPSTYDYAGMTVFLGVNVKTF